MGIYGLLSTMEIECIQMEKLLIIWLYAGINLMDMLSVENFNYLIFSRYFGISEAI